MSTTRAELKELPIESLSPGRFQPRTHFNTETLAELAQSIASSGLLQPIIVRPVGSKHYEIIAGERRWRAVQRLRWETISCLVRDYTDVQAAEAAAIENLQRDALDPMDEAQAYQRMLLEFGYSHDEIAAAVSKSRAAVTNSLRLLKLDLEVQTLVREGELTEGHGKMLVSLPAGVQRQLAATCAANAWNVRQLEQKIRKLKGAPQKKKAASSDVNLKALEQALSDHVGCHVQIDYSEHHGKLAIDFQNLEILQGVLEKLGFDPKIS